jgi:predicted MPP superfamily phosphohydrolase
MSDLHYDSAKPKDTQIILEALWKDLDNFPGIDLILFSGDLVKAGDKRDDFDKAYQVFIEPLLKRTGLSDDEFFIVPGNHDIQMSAIDEIFEKGLKENLVDRESLNSFLDKEMENGFNHIERLENFNHFKSSKFPNRKECKLFSTHVIEKKNTNIGIACLNTAWRATGKGSNHDYGKLLIGERQIDAALKDLKECNLKFVLFHHPLDWLTEYDQGDAENRLFKEFDFLFYGHRHNTNLKLMQKLGNENVLVQGGMFVPGKTIL